MVSSSSSLYKVVLGIPSKTTGVFLLLAATLARRSTSSLPGLPAWDLIHENSIVQFVLRRIASCFLISSIR